MSHLFWISKLPNFQSSRGRIQRKTWYMGSPMPKLTTTSPYVHSRIDSNTFTMGNPMPASTLTLCHSRPCPPNQGGLWIWPQEKQLFTLITPKVHLKCVSESVSHFCEFSIHQCCGSGIRDPVPFLPRIRDPE
jgi:hypothetical protein